MLEILMNQPLKVTRLTAVLMSGSDTNSLESLVSNRIKSIRNSQQRERERESKKEKERESERADLCF